MRNKEILYREAIIQRMAFFLLKKKLRPENNEVIKEKKCKCRFLYIVKMSFKDKGNIQTISGNFGLICHQQICNARNAKQNYSGQREITQFKIQF